MLFYLRKSWVRLIPGLFIILLLITLFISLPSQKLKAEDFILPELIGEFGEQGFGEGQTMFPRSIAINSHDEIFIPNYEGYILKFSSSYVYESSWLPELENSENNNTIERIYIDKKDNILAIDKDNYINKYDENKNFITRWGGSGSGNSQFSNPYHIAFDSSNNIYVSEYSNHRIQKFDENGTFIAKWGTQGTGDGQFKSPESLAVDSENNIYVLDTGNNRIQKFDENGTFIAKWGETSQCLDPWEDPIVIPEYNSLCSPKDIVIDSKDNIFVADTSNFRIITFDTDGNVLNAWGGYAYELGSGYATFLSLSSLALNSQDNLFALDSEITRIQVFKYPETPTDPEDPEEPKTDEITTILTSDTNKTIGIKKPVEGTISSFQHLKSDDAISDTGSDILYEYPLGLVSFKIEDIEVGSTSQIELYFETDYKPNQIKVRKYNPQTKKYTSLNNVEISSVVFENKTGIKLSYEIKDGGELDIDGFANGSITDPIGIAVQSNFVTPGLLVKTGLMTAIPTMLSVLIIFTGLYTYSDYKRHKKPIIEVDEELGSEVAKTYTFRHHLKVVTIPLTKYRIESKIMRRKLAGNHSVVSSK